MIWPSTVIIGLMSLIAIVLVSIAGPSSLTTGRGPACLFELVLVEGDPPRLLEDSELVAEWADTFWQRAKALSLPVEGQFAFRQDRRIQVLMKGTCAGTWPGAQVIIGSIKQASANSVAADLTGSMVQMTCDAATRSCTRLGFDRQFVEIERETITGPTLRELCSRRKNDGFQCNMLRLWLLEILERI